MKHTTSGKYRAAALVLRLFTGRLADRTRRPWPQTITGYALTALCVPLLALSHGLAGAALLYNGERVGKAVRTPARDSMLAHASAKMGRGYARTAAPRLGPSGRPLCASAARTIQTAHALGLTPALDPALGDLDVGRWRGLTLVVCLVIG